MAFQLEPLDLDTSRVAGSSKDAEDRLLAIGGAADKAQDELIGAGRGADRAGKDFDELGNRTDKTRKRMGGLSSVARQLFAGFSAAAFIQQMKLATDASIAYQDSLLKSRTLVGISQKQIESWRPQLAALATDLGRVPQELSEALFFVTSGGERGSAALDLLRDSGKGAALGLGQTQVIADVSGSALNAFGREALDSEEAVNVLFETVREGKAAADSLAPAFSRVTGVASAMGVEFAEVGAFVAAYTRIGGSAEEATFSLSSILTGILSPTDQVREALGRMNIEVDDLRRGIRDDGLAPTLIGLADAIGGNEDALGEVIPEVRALRGFLAVAGEQAETYLGINRRLTDDTLELRDAWTLLKEESPGQELAEIRAEAELLRIEIGDKLTPTYVNFLRAVNDELQKARATGGGSLLPEFLLPGGRIPGPDTATIKLWEDQVDAWGALGEAIEFAKTKGELYKEATIEIQKTARDVVAEGASAYDDLTDAIDESFDAIRKQADIDVLAGFDPVAFKADLERAKLDEEVAALVEELQNVMGAAAPARIALEKFAREQIEGARAMEKHKEEMEDFLDLLERMEQRITIKIEIDDAQVQALLESLGSLPTMSGRGGAGTSQEILDRRRAEAQKKLTDQWVDLQEQANEESAAHQVDTWGEAVSTVALVIENEWQDALAHVLGGVLDAVFSGGDIGAALSGGLGDVGGMLGGIFGDHFGPLGSLLGSALGEQAGKVVGDLVGDLLGFGSHLQDAYSTAVAEGGELLVGVQQGGGEAAAIVDDIMSSVLGTANQIVRSLGGSIDALLSHGLAVQVNVKDGEVREVKAYIDGRAEVFATVDEAINALVGEILALSATSGLDPEIEAILRNAAGKPLEEVNAEVAAAIRVAAGRMGADVANYRDQVRAIFADFATVFGAGGDAMAGTLGRLRDMWDVATGQQKTAAEIFESRKAIILAELDLEIARLEAEQRALQAEADQAQVGITIDEQRLLAHHEVLRGEAHVVQATADFAGQLIAIANMISELEILRGEIATTPFRPPSIPGVSRPSGGPRVDVEAIDREIALAEARGEGNDALVEALLLEEQMAALRERGWTQEQIDRLLAAQAAQEALAEEAAELARQEEEAARQAEALQQQIGDLFGQLESFGDGRSGASGQIQDAIDQMQSMWAALNELRPEDLSPEELAAASEQIQNAIRQTAEEISRVGTDLVTGTLAGALQTAIDRETDPQKRLALQKELFELERALGIIKQQAAIAELEQVETLMRSQGLWTAELEAQANRAIELFSAPWPEFSGTIDAAGSGFRRDVDAAASAFGNSLNNAGSILAELAGMESQSASMTGVQRIMAEFRDLEDRAWDTRHAFNLLGTSFEEVQSRIHALRQAEVEALFGSTVGEVQARLRPGGDLMIGQSNRQRLASIQDQINEAIRTGDFQRAAQLASAGLDVAGGTSSRIFGEFAAFVDQLSLDQHQAETAGDQRASMLNVMELQMAERAQQHQVTESNRLMQTREMGERLDTLTGTVADQTILLGQLVEQQTFGGQQ